MTNICSSILLTLLLYYTLQSSASRFKEYERVAMELPESIKKVFMDYEIAEFNLDRLGALYLLTQ